MPNKVEIKANRRTWVIDCMQEEYRIAQNIMQSIIIPELQNNPELNLCRIRSLCEQMQTADWNAPQEVEACDPGRPMTTRG